MKNTYTQKSFKKEMKKLQHSEYMKHHSKFFGIQYDSKRTYEDRIKEYLYKKFLYKILPKLLPFLLVILIIIVFLNR